MSCCVFTTFVINTIYLLVSLHNLIFNNGCINNLGSKKYLMILIISPWGLLMVQMSTHWFFFPLSSVAQSCLTLCDRMDCSTPGLPVHHQLLEFIQTHVH